jgi:hypothetical protein
VTQEHLTRREREQRASDELAAKLDALSRPLAERVLGRAIELDEAARAEAEAAADSIDYEMLKEVALEVGITEGALKRALLEELDTDKDHNPRPVERLTVPDAVHGGLIVPGKAAEVAERLRTHLASAAGGAGVAGQQRRSIWAAAPRSAPPVHTRTVAQATSDRQLVEIDVETARSRGRAWRWLIAVLVLGALFGSPLGGLVILGIWVAGMVAVVGWLKRIGRSARRSINRALQAAAGDRNPQAPGSWLDVWEETQR